VLLLLVCISASGQALPIESGKFRLHKFEQAIGEESYEIKRDGDSLVISSRFEFTDRGSHVPLSATLRTRQDLTPQNFVIKGNVSRFSNIDTAVEIKDSAATVREGKTTRDVNLPPQFFTISGYAPVTLQQMLVRYVDTHRVHSALATLPSGQVTIELRGKDSVSLGDKQVELRRYTVSGLIWGRETLWFDSTKNLVAAVTLDAEFDHFEALREGYESALPVFVAKAAADGMEALAQLAQRISPVNKGALAILGATLIDGTGATPIENAMVIIEGDRIISAGPHDKIKIPSKAKRIDARGKFLLPGLWDMHSHFEQVEWGPIYLAAGVTTVRDVGNEFEFITSVRDAIKEGRGLGPRLLLAGIVDGDSLSALGIVRADTPDEARAVVNRYQIAGFQQIKIYSSVKPAIVKAICEQAHKLGMTVTGHIPNGMNAIEGVTQGMDQISHIQYIPPVMRSGTVKATPVQPPPAIDFQSAAAQQAISLFKSHNTVLDPTMAIFEWALHPADTPFSTIEPGAAKLPAELAGAINNTGVPAAVAPRAKAILEQYFAVLRALHQAGITIVAGTDQVVPGHSLHRELELYVKAGFTPLEAIQAATLIPARVMKVNNEVGTIEAGKRADMIILTANPLVDIHNIRSVKTVIAGGRIYDCAQLWTSVGFKP